MRTYALALVLASIFMTPAGFAREELDIRNIHCDISDEEIVALVFRGVVNLLPVSENGPRQEFADEEEIVLYKKMVVRNVPIVPTLDPRKRLKLSFHKSKMQDAVRSPQWRALSASIPPVSPQSIQALDSFLKHSIFADSGPSRQGELHWDLFVIFETLLDDQLPFPSIDMIKSRIVGGWRRHCVRPVFNP